MTPVSVAAFPAQPNAQFYGFSALQIFTEYTRDSYLAQFGVQAPAWNRTRGKKTWFDSSATNDRSYPIAPTDPGATSLPLQSFTAADASTVNLPGLPTFQPYVVAPSGAFLQGTPTHLANANILSTMAQATALAAELGVSTNQIMEELAGAVIYPADDPRRVLVIAWGTDSHHVSVGDLLVQKNAKGLGYPGHWDLSGADPVFVFDSLDDGISTGANTLPLVPVPLRPLMPNEQIKPAGLVSMVYRTDKQPATPSTGTGGFTDEDRATIGHMQDTLNTIVAGLKKFGLV